MYILLHTVAFNRFPAPITHVPFDAGRLLSIINLNRKFSYQLIHRVRLGSGIEATGNRETLMLNNEQIDLYIVQLEQRNEWKHKKNKNKKKDACVNKKWLCGSDIDLWRFPKTPAVRSFLFSAHFKC